MTNMLETVSQVGTSTSRGQHRGMTWSWAEVCEGWDYNAHDSIIEDFYQNAMYSKSDLCPDGILWYWYHGYWMYHGCPLAYPAQPMTIP